MTKIPDSKISVEPDRISRDLISCQGKYFIAYIDTRLSWSLGFFLAVLCIIFLFLVEIVDKPVFQICAFTSMTVVIISTLTFVLSTMPELGEEIDIVPFDNETEMAENSVERWDQVWNFSSHIFRIAQ